MGTNAATATTTEQKPRRLSLKRLLFLLPLAGLAVAAILHAAQWVTSWIATALARGRGAFEVCTDLLTDVTGDGTKVSGVEIVDYAPWGYRCEAQLDNGGVGIQDFSAGTSALFYLTLGIAGLSIVVLVGLVLASAVIYLLRPVVPLTSRDRVRGRWPLRTVGLGLFLLPMTLLWQYLRWYGASNSGGSTICPDTVDGNEVFGFGVTANYLPPSLTCSGHTVTGEEFSVTEYGVAFYGFLGCLALIALGSVLVIITRVRDKRR